MDRDDDNPDAWVTVRLWRNPPLTGLMVNWGGEPDLRRAEVIEVLERALRMLKYEPQEPAGAV